MRRIWHVDATEPLTRKIDWWPAAWSGSGTRNWPRWNSCNGSMRSCPNKQRSRFRPPNASRSAIWLMICQLVFHAPTTTFAERKQLLRWLIKDVTRAIRGNVIDVAIRWQTEALTHLAIPRHKKSWEMRQTNRQVVSRVRELAPTHTDTRIAV